MHYFLDREKAKDDMLLQMAISQAYVPKECLLVGQVVMGLMNKGIHPCSDCRGDRDVCKGRSFVNSGRPGKLFNNCHPVAESIIKEAPHEK